MEYCSTANKVIKLSLDVVNNYDVTYDKHTICIFKHEITLLRPEHI